jgi:hypothetical protein
MIRICDHPDCDTLTLGSLCAVHEQAPAATVRFPRGRPFPRLPVRTALEVLVSDPVELTPAPAVSFGGGTAR